MPSVYFTELESRALPALDLPAFPINLRQVRDTVEILLKEVGRYGFYNEYTDHSFDHVLGMIKVAEWVIPDSTKENLKASDWLFIVLGIYFHDVGLLISRDEFAKRDENPDFTKFRNNPPIPIAKYEEFEARLAQLEPTERDRILYQEFVRFSHGQRIRAWIEGADLDDNNARSLYEM